MPSGAALCLARAHQASGGAGTSYVHWHRTQRRSSSDMKVPVPNSICNSRPREDVNGHVSAAGKPSISFQVASVRHRLRGWDSQPPGLPVGARSQGAAGGVQLLLC